MLTFSTECIFTCINIKYFQIASKEKEVSYVVVLFLPRKETGNLIDLVPSSWVFTDEIGTVFCKYPCQADYDKLQQWVSSRHEPSEEWECFEIEILSYARKYICVKKRNSELQDKGVA